MSLGVPSMPGALQTQQQPPRGGSPLQTAAAEPLPPSSEPPHKRARQLQPALPAGSGPPASIHTGSSQVLLLATLCVCLSLCMWHPQLYKQSQGTYKHTSAEPSIEQREAGRLLTMPQEDF